MHKKDSQTQSKPKKSMLNKLNKIQIDFESLCGEFETSFDIPNEGGGGGFWESKSLALIWAIFQSCHVLTVIGGGL